jgi:hypothetical protein
MKQIQPPHSTYNATNTVFLAGSIEMGKAIDWQNQIMEKCKDLDVTFLNPRRDDWDSSWEQKITNPNFREQVEWELSALEDSDKIVFFFDPNTTSPITLLELGLFSGSIICVCCPNGYYRKGNVDIVCDRYNIPMVETIDGLIEFIKQPI